MNPLDKALNLRPMETIDNETGEVTEVFPVTDTEVDPYFQEAQQDAEQVRLNIKKLIDDGFEMFNDVAGVAKNTQNPDQYQAAARFYSELIKANKELMNIHRDVFAMKPISKEVPEEKPTQNILIATSDDIIEMLRSNGIGRLRGGGKPTEG